MKTFVVYTDRTITMRQEASFSVEAEDEKEAKAKIARLVHEDFVDWDTVDIQGATEPTYTMEEK